MTLEHHHHLGLVALPGGQHAISFEGVLNAAHVYLDGHFEGFPVFPAVAQIELVEDKVSEFLGKPVELVGIDKSKFRKVCVPNDKFQLHIDVNDQEQTGKWQLISCDGEGSFSEGSFAYHDI